MLQKQQEELQLTTKFMTLQIKKLVIEKNFMWKGSSMSLLFF
jgi:hypothetical protein